MPASIPSISILFAPLTLENFREALSQAPFLRYGFNTFVLVTMLLAAQLIVGTLAAYAFARFEFAGSNIAFALVLVQLMITPEILIVENYGTLANLGLVDTILGIGLPYMASAFGIFLLRQAFKSVPKELEEAARLEGCGLFGILMRVYVPLARPTYLAYGLVSISHHWNNFLWPLVITNSVETRPSDGWTGRLCFAGIGGRLVHHLCRHASIRRAVVDRVPAVPAPVRSVVHVCRHQMTQILSWNIQNGKGVDDTISLARIASVIKEMGDPDVICLQEVSRHMPLGNGERASPDQVAEISDLFPDHEAMFGPAVEGSSAEGAPRWQFGNVTLTRLPVLSAFQHALPQPSEPGLRHMARQAIETTLKTSAWSAARDEHAPGIPFCKSAPGTGGAVTRHPF